MKFTFRDVVEGKYQLTEEQQESALKILGHGCRQKTKARIASVLRYPRGLASRSLFSHLHFSTEHSHANYCAGQSMPEELREFRTLLG